MAGLPDALWCRWRGGGSLGFGEGTDRRPFPLWVRLVSLWHGHHLPGATPCARPHTAGCLLPAPRRGSTSLCSALVRPHLSHQNQNQPWTQTTPGHPPPGSPPACSLLTLLSSAVHTQAILLLPQMLPPSACLPPPPLSPAALPGGRGPLLVDAQDGPAARLLGTLAG